MNRELRFRVWDKKNKIMHYLDTEFIYFSYELPQKHELIDCGERKVVLYTDNIKIKKATEDLIFLQSTGLKDKNGKEIFEGDILLDNNNWILVLNWITADYEILHKLSKAYDLFTVIGNIYENRRLIVEEDK